MLTEPVQPYQDQLNEQQAKGLLWLGDQIKAHPFITGIIVVLIAIATFGFILPAIIRYCQKHGIKSTSEIASPEHLNDKIRHADVRKKRISILPAPAVDPKFCKMELPTELDDLAQSIERAETSHRTRYCVVCQDTELIENYARMFYHRIENAPTIDHYGWVYCKEPRDKNLKPCIGSAFFESLRIFNEIALPEKRFIRQIDFFDKANMHTLLVIRKTQTRTEEDHELLQIASLAGLSVVLFSADPIPGYPIINILQEGGIPE